ncbi:MAG: hypothetical protein NTW74_11235, partial [Acidobacteria bacterium]|nr:hypothetical protein [Acidobacteriota bacterium]
MVSFLRFLVLILASSTLFAQKSKQSARPVVPIQFPRATPIEVRNLMQRMTLREMVGQLVIVPFYGENPASKRREYQEYLRLVKQAGVGGLILLNRVQGGIVRNAEPFALASFLN